MREKRERTNYAFVRVWGMPQTLTKRGWDPTGFCLRGRHQPDVIRALWATTDAVAQRWAAQTFS